MNRIALALTLTAAIGLTACKGAKEDEAGGPTAAVQTVPASERELAPLLVMAKWNLRPGMRFLWSCRSNHR